MGFNFLMICVSLGISFHFSSLFPHMYKGDDEMCASGETYSCTHSLVPRASHSASMGTHRSSLQTQM